MNYFKYNDNEVIYLIRLGNEEAYDFIYKKYKRFIYAKIKKFGLHDLDDSFQEGCIALFKAIRSYDEVYEKTFNKYFERVLINRFLDIKRKVETDYELILSEKLDNSHLFLRESNNSYDDKMYEVLKASLKLTKREKEIFDYIYIKKLSTLEVSSILNTHIGNIYKIIYQIKNKIKKNVIQ